MIKHVIFVSPMIHMAISSNRQASVGPPSDKLSRQTKVTWQKSAGSACSQGPPKPVLNGETCGSNCGFFLSKNGVTTDL